MTFSLGNGNARQLSNFQKVFVLAEHRLDVEYAIIILKFCPFKLFHYHASSQREEIRVAGIRWSKKVVWSSYNLLVYKITKCGSCKFLRTIIL